jgi:hypothetical protein
VTPRRQRAPAHLVRSTRGTNLMPAPLSLSGELAGEWSEVEANVVFGYDFTAKFPDVGLLQILVRSYPATRDPDTTRYRAQWDRAGWWLDFDGDGPGIPHLLASSQIDASYVPQAINDPYPEFASEPAVQAACTTLQPCSIEASPFVALREPGVDYSSYPNGAASTDLLFVADHTGTAIAGLLDIYDANDEYVESKFLEEGDQLELSALGFKLSEPEFIYVVTVTDFTELDQSLRIERANHIPGVDFPDPQLPADFNAAQRSMKLLLDARAGTEENPVFAYGGPYALGFTWQQVLDYIHANGFETPLPAPSGMPLVQPRR